MAKPSLPVELLKIIVDQPDMPLPELIAELKARGVEKAAENTVSAYRADYKRTLAILRDMGVLRRGRGGRVSAKRGS